MEGKGAGLPTSIPSLGMKRMSTSLAVMATGVMSLPLRAPQPEREREGT
eukprot:CAMPEP_0172085678 /NCGR_PEP_ID=MMETSP1043-20130122/21685_1 /TAXON_ID=464988 /ORGANISM="Hemiselmis andersenii, Strain CCMP441" /LENGTH=48 /DNA_ID= /DNA_START= /DNA_END= /DNA_ORIENTATION=